MLRKKSILQKKMKDYNSIDTDDRVMVLAICTFPYTSPSVYQVSFVYLQYFRNMPSSILLLQILGREITNYSVITP